MSALLDQILLVLVDRLVREGQLSLTPSGSVDALAEELRVRLADAPPFSSAGPYIARALMESDYVDELFATDSDIIDALNAVRS